MRPSSWSRRSVTARPRITRRELLARLAGGLAASAVSPLLDGLSPAEARARGVALRLLGEDEGRTLEALGEVLLPGARALIGTGIAVEIPPGFEAQIRPRSGLALRHGVTLLNSPGTIDSDYRGEIMVLMINLGDQPYTVRRGDRIAQMIVAPVARAQWREVETLATTRRGPGGFGHTDVD